jgi:hypothetical protein
MRVLGIRIAPYCVIFPHDEIHPDVGNKKDCYADKYGGKKSFLHSI